jgi:hypothetical protein
MPLNDPPRLLFSSYHGLLDPSSGAALAAETWRPERLLPRFEAFFRAALRSGKEIGSCSVENLPDKNERGASAP